MSLRYFHPAAVASSSDAQPDTTVTSRPVVCSRTRARQPPPCNSTEKGRIDLRALLPVIRCLLPGAGQVACPTVEPTSVPPASASNLLAARPALHGAPARRHPELLWPGPHAQQSGRAAAR